MTDSIVDDVQVLLDKELGDKRILGQILRAAQNNEVISNFERNYVNKLVEKYLRPKPPVEKIIPEIPNDFKEMLDYYKLTLDQEFQTIIQQRLLCCSHADTARSIFHFQSDRPQPEPPFQLVSVI